MKASLSIACVILAFIFCVLAVFGAVPLWVSVLTLCVALLVGHVIP